MSDFNAIELQERGGVIVETLSDAVEEVEDHLYTGVICEVVEAGEWREKPVRLWFNRRWYEVRELAQEQP